jgi:hypothetical protein
MKYKTQFRLAVQAIAVFILLLSSPLLVYFMYGVIQGYENEAYLYMDWYEYIFYGMILLPSFLATLLFFRPNLVVNLAIPSNKPYCPECGYRLTKPILDHCAECGTALPKDLRDEINMEKDAVS